MRRRRTNGGPVVRIGHGHCAGREWRTAKRIVTFEETREKQAHAKHTPAPLASAARSAASSAA